jgi:tellurite resistance protein TerC
MNGIAKPHESIRAAASWTIFWIVLALLFTVILWIYSPEKALAFFTGYLIEKSLSFDNLFVFYVIFKHFQIPLASQQRIFAYGIWGAIVMRLILILLGTWLVSHFHWVLYLMGVFLLLTGLKMLMTIEKEKNFADNFMVKCAKRYFRLTPFFIVLILIEVSDLIFAIDSIPAIFAITTDPFIVWASNIFAILGLRAMYFMLSGALLRFHLLKYGIALILVFVGVKMVIEPWVYISVGLSLTVIIGILLLFTLMSFMQNRRQGS